MRMLSMRRLIARMLRATSRFIDSPRVVGDTVTVASELEFRQWIARVLAAHEGQDVEIYHEANDDDSLIKKTYRLVRLGSIVRRVCIVRNVKVIG